MPFTLGDIENDCLAELGSTNPSPNYGAGLYPVWAGAQGNPRYGQGLIDVAIVNACQKILSGLRDISLITTSFKFPTVSQQFRYPIPTGNVAQGSLVFAGVPAPGVNISLTIGGQTVNYTTNQTDTSLAAVTGHIISLLNASTITQNIVGLVSPQSNTINTIVLTARATGIAGNAITLVSSVTGSVTTPPLTATFSHPTLTGGTDTSPNIVLPTRVRYQPYGMPYIREKAPGVRLIAWTKFQMMNAAGYLEAFAFSTEPDVCAVTPDRKYLEFFPAPVTSGDLVTLEYVPAMTTGTNDPILVNQNDVIPFPDDLRDLVFWGAMVRLWPIAGEMELAKEYAQRFRDELQRIREDWDQSSAGETLQIVDFASALQNTGWYQ